MTGKEMCEYSFRVLKERGLLNPEWANRDPEEFWNANPSGGLMHVFTLYQMAKSIEGYEMQVEYEHKPPEKIAGAITWTAPEGDTIHKQMFGE